MTFCTLTSDVSDLPFQYYLQAFRYVRAASIYRVVEGGMRGGCRWLKSVEGFLSTLGSGVLTVGKYCPSFQGVPRAGMR